MPTLKNLSETQVKKLAHDMAVEHKGQDLVIGLIGNLGAGKTTFTKSFAKALGIGKTKSPTFTIVADYTFRNTHFYHIDFYRLNRLDDLQAIGLKDLLQAQSRIVVIEWVDKFRAIQNQCDILIKLKINKLNRDVEIIYR